MFQFTYVSENRIRVSCPKVGDVSLSKFSPVFDHGLYAARPWHVVTFGRNFATVDECLAFLAQIEANWEDEPEESGEWHGQCHGEMTHSFLATEADSCPW